MSEKIVDKNTAELYDFYSSRMADPTKKYGSVLCVSLDNIDYIDALRANNTVTVVSEQYNIINDYTFVSERDLRDYLKNMKFDYIIMNPPYGNLYLPIIREASKYINETGKLVSLNPINRIQDAIKHDKNLPCKCTDIDRITQAEMCNLFGICSWGDGCIISVTKNADDDSTKWTNLVDNYKILSKLKSQVTALSSKFEKTPQKYSVRFFVGCNCDAGHGYTITPKTYDGAKDQKINGHVAFINMKSELERENLHKSCCTVFMRFCCKLDINIRPYMSDYSHAWTDEDFYKFFNITPAEQKIIEDTMKPYM